MWLAIGVSFSGVACDGGFQLEGDGDLRDDGSVGDDAGPGDAADGAEEVPVDPCSGNLAGRLTTREEGWGTWGVPFPARTMLAGDVFVFRFAVLPPSERPFSGSVVGADSLIFEEGLIDEAIPFDSSPGRWITVEVTEDVGSRRTWVQLNGGDIREVPPDDGWWDEVIGVGFSLGNAAIPMAPASMWLDGISLVLRRGGEEIVLFQEDFESGRTYDLESARLDVLPPEIPLLDPGWCVAVP